MKRRAFLALAPGAVGGQKREPGFWLERARTFAETLLEVGLDHYGPKAAPAWAGVIDTRGWSVPEKGVPAAPGIREGDRAVGGANLYHDSSTLRLFHALTGATGDERYRRAARDYTAWFLKECQSPATGLLAWGEHLYYDFFRDRVATERRSHELLEWTPPWGLLWEANAEATARAIAGLRYHHLENKPGALYNRHASYERAELQKAEGAQPWIKHSGAYAYSFAFLHARTGEKLWLDWAKGEAGIYWERRNPKTNLTLSCIDDPRPGSKMATIYQGMLAYWIRRAGELVPGETLFRERARALIHAWEKYGWDAGRGGWRSALWPDGKPASKELVEPWHFAYGANEMLPYGRIAAYFAGADKDKTMLEAARRAARIARRSEVPGQASAQGVGMALNLALDLHELEPEGAWLKDAEFYANLAEERYWRQEGRRGLFVRLAGDPYYEAKTGAGDLAAGLLRLDGALRGKRVPGDWTL